ncbi:MAG TPA: 4-alpha-glucanotransferase [Bacteroidota bacterium]|nr:4-alpha-glucanotransferase [Bacteroidota bacterium]
MKFSRSSGILLHPTSLPGPFGSGDLGASSYHFVDWLRMAGQTLWQMLPLGPAGMANSPYMGLSAFAGNPLLVDLQELQRRNWLREQEVLPLQVENQHRIDFSKTTSFRMKLLKKASERFFIDGTKEDHSDFEKFCEQEKLWLHDYALFQSINQEYKNHEWTTWNQDLVSRKPNALEEAAKKHAATVQLHKFIQWCFSRQWNALKKYAHERDVRLLGDIPFFVAYHSAEVWANPEQFLLDNHGEPTAVAGVPPDYFSATGQRWGNPLYRWDVMKKNRYAWWIERFRKMFELFDAIRIDHFRGFESYWEIPAEEETAVKGKWVKGPGEDFFKIIQRSLPELSIVAEDLGIITKEVTALREKLEFPGMKVLHFAFNGNPKNDYLPHRYETNCVVYTGTHDNDTTRGWYEKASEHERDFVRRYCKTDGHEMHWDLIKLALQSVADVAIIPFQDVMGLGSEGRMNYPGTIDENWDWRFTWDQLGDDPAKRLYELTALYDRCKDDKLHLI